MSDLVVVADTHMIRNDDELGRFVAFLDSLRGNAAILYHLGDIFNIWLGSRRFEMPHMEPVLIVADSELQERPISEKDKLRVQKITRTAPPQGDSGAVAEAARLLVAAQSPVIIADRAARTAAGMKYLVELAETLQAPVIDQGGRMNFPSRHALNQSSRGRALIAGADVVLGLELTDFWGSVNAYRDQLERSSRPITKPGTKLISITAGDLYIKSNYQDFERYPEIDIAMAADAEATLPSLIEAVKRLSPIPLPHRLTFLLRSVEGFTASEVSYILDKPGEE